MAHPAWLPAVHTDCIILHLCQVWFLNGKYYCIIIMYVYVCMYHMYMCVCIYICMYRMWNLCMYVYVGIYNVCVYVCMYVCMGTACMHACIDCISVSGCLYSTCFCTSKSAMILLHGTGWSRSDLHLRFALGIMASQTHTQLYLEWEV